MNQPMYNAQKAICCERSCENSSNKKDVLCCSACGQCGDHEHSDCAKKFFGIGKL